MKKNAVRYKLGDRLVDKDGNEFYIFGITGTIFILVSEELGLSYIKSIQEMRKEYRLKEEDKKPGIIKRVLGILGFS
jgi:hypothetical protein